MSENNFRETKTAPPKWALRFLAWFCPAPLHEGVEGDLLEQFDEDLKRGAAPDGSGSPAAYREARRKFVWNTVNFFRPDIILRYRDRFTLINTIMIGNYFKVASRNILRRKMYSFINAFGLSVGIAFCILIFLFIMDEKSFDQFHANKNEIYRLEEKSFDMGQRDPNHSYFRSAYLPKGIAPAVKEELPEVVYAT